MKKLITVILLLTCVAFGAELEEPKKVELSEIILSPTRIAKVTDANEIEIVETKKTVHSKERLLDRKQMLEFEVLMLQDEIKRLQGELAEVGQLLGVLGEGAKIK